MDSETAIKTRGYIRQRATNTCNKVNDEFAGYNLQQCLMNKNKLISLQNELEELNKFIINESIKEKKPDKEIQELFTKDEEYSDKIGESLSKLELASLQNAPISAAQAPTGSHFDKNYLKLPKVDLPTFSNKKGESL